MRFRFKRVCSSAWLERTPDKGEVGGSSPPRPTNFTELFYRRKPIVVRTDHNNKTEEEILKKYYV